MRVRAVLALALCLPACHLASRNPITSAERAAKQGRFLVALNYLDQVPSSSLRYSEARTFARALERRIRTSHERILEGLALRNEWRDREAIERFEEALAIWSDVAGAEGLISATRHRIANLGTDPGKVPAGVRQVDNLPTVTTTPVAMEPSSDATRAAPGFEPSPQVDSSEDTVDRPGAGRLEGSRWRVVLEQVQRLLARGETSRALALLEDLREENPEDPRVTGVLARVLHQRALLSYGQGRLEAAIDDWRKVVSLQKENRQAQAFLRAAETELAWRGNGG